MEDMFFIYLIIMSKINSFSPGENTIVQQQLMRCKKVLMMLVQTSLTNVEIHMNHGLEA